MFWYIALEYYIALLCAWTYPSVWEYSSHFVSKWKLSCHVLYMLSAGMYCCIMWQQSVIISENPPECQCYFVQLHGIMPKRTQIFIVTLIFHSPTNALFIKLGKVKNLGWNSHKYRSYMFRSSTIIRKLVLSLAKVILKHSVKLCPCRLCGGVVACLQ
jgi:hypothetical protein